MRNSPLLPSLALAVSLALAGYLLLFRRDSGGPLTELDLGAVAAAMSLAIFGLQGLISIAIEGQELDPGRSSARLTGSLSVGIFILSVFLIAVAVLLAIGIADDWSLRLVGSLAGAGSITLALLLVFYKEAYIGDEATFDDRQDGVPW